jgi:hypothetical protein
MQAPTVQIRASFEFILVFDPNAIKQELRFCTLDHAFSNYDERKTNEMNFQSKPHI